jgi:competence protein ComFC
MHRGRIMERLEKLWEFIFPSNIYCVCCESVIDKTRPYALCDRCVQKFHWMGKKTCMKCGKILEEGYAHDLCIDCRDMNHQFVKGFTCTRYGLYERVLMMDYKYHDKAWIGRKLGDILADRMQSESFRPDLVVPIPIHKDREAKRGYNQAELMARHYAKLAKITLDNRTLIRTKNTLPMRNLGVTDRIANVREAFSIRKGSEDILAGKIVLLIDDIYTTGSTADSCTQTLLQAGAKEVWLLTFASGSNVIPSNSLQ